MAALGRFKVEYYWSKKEISSEEGAPYRLNKYMTRDRFRELNACHALTDKKSPRFKDGLWEVR